MDNFPGKAYHSNPVALHKYHEYGQTECDSVASLPVIPIVFFARISHAAQYSYPQYPTWPPTWRLITRYPRLRTTS